MFKPLLALTVLASVTSAQLTVTSMSPAPRSLFAHPHASIVLTFSSSVSAASLTPQSFRVFGRWSGVHVGMFGLDVSGTQVTFTSDRPFFVGEMVTVHVSRAVQSTGGATLASGFAATFWTRASQGQGTFRLTNTITVRRPSEPPIITYGIYAGDLDHDGSIDLSAVNENSSDIRVFRGDGCGSYNAFVAHSLASGTVPSTNEGQDFNGDGHTDLAVGGIVGNTVNVLIGDGSGGYFPVQSYPSGTSVRGLTVLDFDGDGHMDIATANRSSSNVALHRGRGDGTFAAARFIEGGGSGETGIAAGDADGDGIQDLFVAHYNSARVTLLLGDGAGNFSLSSSVSVGSRPWMIVVGDITGDGHLDAATCNAAGNTLSVIPGSGTGMLLSDTTYRADGFPLAIDLGDLDGDGDLDMIGSNYSGGTYTVYRNLGGGVMGQRQDLPASTAGSCAIIADSNRDGVMDIIGIDELDDLIFLFEQDVANPQGVQPRSCSASLRIDNLAAYAGFGSNVAIPIQSPGLTTLGLSTDPLTVHTYVFGIRLEPGISMSYGIVNLDPQLLIFGGSFTADGAGESSVNLRVPAGLPSGARFSVQAVCVPSGILTLSNPLEAQIL